MSVLDRLGRKALFAFDPETAHDLSIAALKTGFPLCRAPAPSPRIAVSVAGLEFPNPLGMAAGYDKNAEVPDALLGLGFGFVEVGTATPLPQSGNLKPRIFRLTRDRAVINRLGFNNEGHERVLERLRQRRDRPGIVGVNIGANKDSSDRVADYELGVRRLAGLASYLTVNISSPNTPGLRNLQARESLAELLSRVVAARDERVQPPGRRVPLFLKIAPDLEDADLDDVAAEVEDKGLDGLIVSNTTLSRTGLTEGQASEAGGLSGRPLFHRSTMVLAKMRQRLGPQPVIIGAGGVYSVETALEKIRAGADLVQLYTGMIYAGPSLPGEIVRGMARYVEVEGLANIRDIRDSRLAHWASQRISD